MVKGTRMRNVCYKAKFFIFFITLQIILVSFTSFIPNLSADAPWPMLGHDERHTGQSNYRGSQNNNVKWRYGVSTYEGVQPAVASDGTIYVGSSDSKFYAINPDGQLKWTYATGGGIGSSPAIDSEGTIYFGSNDGKFYALNPSGALKWSYAGGFGSSSPTIAPDGSIYVGCSYDYSLYVFDKNGNLKWKNGRGPYSNGSGVAIGTNGNIYFVYDQFLFAISPSPLPSDPPLNYIWAYSINTGYPTTPSVGSDGTIYVGSSDKNLYAINSNGTLKWKYMYGGNFLVSAVPTIASDGTIYIGSYDTYLYAINPNGTLKWKYQIGSRTDYDSPAIDIDGTIYFGRSVLNSNGTLKWIYNTDYSTGASPVIASDGSVYIYTRAGLYACGESAIKTIFGTLRYENKIYNETGSGDPSATEFKPIRFAKVEVIKDSDKTVLGAVETKGDGTYSIKVSTSTNDKVFLKCYPQQNTAPNIIVKDIAGNIYSKASALTTLSGSTAIINLDVPTNSNEGGAFNIFDCFEKVRVFKK